MPSRLVLFVCSGNICRSPMAEYLLRPLLRNVPGWETRSAGILAEPGITASPEAVQALAELDIDLTPHRSHPLTTTLIEQAELVVPMTRGHRDILRTIRPQARDKLFLLRSFDPHADAEDLEDPIGGSLKTYRHCRDLIRACLPQLCSFLAELD